MAVVYSGVAVGFPAKVAGNEAEDEWQEVDWVTWTTGDLTVDEDFLLVFKPSGAGSSSGVKSKPLGNLIRAAPVSQDDGRTVVVTTNDSLHRVYRFTFGASTHAAAFAKKAKAAEERTAAAERQRASAKCGTRHVAESAARLEAEIREKLGSLRPLVFVGVELYGPDPSDSSGTEVLRGRGGVALIDPPAQGNVVGTYELLFFSEDDPVKALRPLEKFVIAPGMVLGTQKREEDGAASFTLTTAAAGNMLLFDCASVATGFDRDFRVRQRVMELASKTAKGRQAASNLRGEIEDLKRQTIGARFLRLVATMLTLLVLGSLIRVAMLYSEDPRRSGPQYFTVLKHDAVKLGKWSYSTLMTPTAKVCQLLLDADGAIPRVELQNCVSLDSTSQAKRCVEDLIGR